MSSPNQPTRRDFLHGQVVSKLVDNLARIVYEDPPSPMAANPLPAASTSCPLLSSFRRRAMACEFEVQLPASGGKSAESVLTALDLLEGLESQLTVYRDDSEVIRINRQAASRPVQVEPRLFALLELAACLHRDTDGALDLTTGPLSDVWGFFRRQGRLPSEEEVEAALKHVGMDKITFDATDRTLSFRESGVAIHLNCIGKGYALDRMAESLDAAEVGDYLLHGGRSSVLARGQCPGSDRSSWTIGLPHPLLPGQRLAEIELLNQALGTSGSATQSFELDGQRYGHLLDPRSGRPVTDIYTATAIASSAAEADALSTAFYVMGPEKVRRFCTTRPEVGAILVCPGDSARDVRLFTYGLDGCRWHPLAGT